MTTENLAYKLVLIEWIDAEHEAEWSPIADEIKHELYHQFSVGWLIHENKDRLVLASCICPGNNEISNKEYLPIGMIVQRKILWNPGETASWRDMWLRPFDRPELIGESVDE
jgi:hypothetical protein